MKHILIFQFIIIVIVFSCADPNQQKAGKSLTTISVDSVKNVGIIPYGMEHKIEFNLENTGKNVLTIYNVEPFCGCTRVNYSKKPVKPGKSLIIEVYYDAKSFGMFNKQVELHCNTPASVHFLSFNGEIRDEEIK